MTESLAPPRVEEVADQTFAYIQPDGSWMINNTGFVVGEATVLSIDACSTERRTRAYLEAIRSTTDAPVSTVVNTHGHPDHTTGNCVLEPAAIVGHPLCRDAVLQAAAMRAAIGTVFAGFDAGDVVPAPPFITFTDRLDLHVDDRRVELHAVGEPAHTTHDVVAWVPDRSVLYTGDLVFNGGTPFFISGSLEGTLRANDWLRSFGATTLVPGHGEVCGIEILDTIDGYVRWVQGLAAAGRDDGLRPLDVARRADLGPYAEWLDTERLVVNVHRAYLELEGAPPGEPIQAPIFDEMVEFHGGPLRCLA